jgi:molybdenum cofactor cytidylyltransferase
MRAQEIDIDGAIRRMLAEPIFRSDGRKVLAGGHLLNDTDVETLRAEGLKHVRVVEVEPGEIGEEEAIRQVVGELACGSLEVRFAAAGRANLFATEPSCLLIDDECLRQINSISSVMVATRRNFTVAERGQRVAMVKSSPFTVAREHLEVVLSVVRERGPIIQARPIREPNVAVLYSDPIRGERARQLFSGVMQQRMDRHKATAMFVLTCLENQAAVARSLQHLVSARPATILIASTTSPSGPSDVIGRALTQIGCHIERFLAPVEPGNLLMLGYKDDTPIVSAPGCFRSAKANVLDLLLPPMLARYRISSWEIANLGHGGLLS